MVAAFPRSGNVSFVTNPSFLLVESELLSSGNSNFLFTAFIFSACGKHCTKSGTSRERWRMVLVTLLGEFILKERNYLDGVINEDELVNLDFLNVINANDELLITFEDTGTIQPIHEDLEGMSDFKRHIWI